MSRGNALRLLFNYKTNLLKAKRKSLSDSEKILLRNVKRTVKVFKNMTGGAPEVEMWDNEDCFTAINELQMTEGHDLALDFRREDQGIIKGDICRLVQLYNTGGFYFDLDVAPLDALQKVLDPRATFVTTKEVDGDFFQAFLATTPKHPVIRKSLTNLVLIHLHVKPEAFFEFCFLHQFYCNWVENGSNFQSNPSCKSGCCCVWYFSGSNANR